MRTFNLERLCHCSCYTCAALGFTHVDKNVFVGAKSALHVSVAHSTQLVRDHICMHTFNFIGGDAYVNLFVQVTF